MSPTTSATSTLAPLPGVTAFTDRRFYLVGGWAAIIGALVYIVQPIIVFTFFPPTESTDPRAIFDDVASMQAKAWTGPVEVALFTAIGAAIIVLAVAVGRLLAERASLGAIWPRVTTSLGIISGAGWFFAAAVGAALRSSVGAALAETGADQVMQRAVIQGVNIMVTAGLMLAVIAFGGWLIGFIVLGKRGALIGWPLVIVSALMLCAVLSAALPTVPPLGVLLLIPFLLVLGIAFLTKARTARR
ncbi:hypothetical protein [Leifsonia sp. Leaf264]|uniref:hypothetical protein n=1 Tax=Leifsonia sp. Leaf264 TaxID=1736314 RepID=UPI0006FD9B57|nr:hypothetical protein [Leifsonia sp. Leaf264]KQO99674.1 hypothetical protein ASF30_07115 [Leifsonia sp. Leaf264]